MRSDRVGLLPKLLISAFIVVHAVVICFRNCPVWLATWSERTAKAHLSPMNAWRLSHLPYWAHVYGHKVGLDNKWDMYSRLHRFDWWLVSVGVDRDGNSVLLPEPFQSQRTWWQSTFVDFREAKFYLNIYDRPEQEAQYASYLLRKYPEHQGVPIEKIRFDLHYRMFFENPEEARRWGTHYHGPEAVIVMRIWPEGIRPDDDEATATEAE